jgi:predicted small integral membrane protein
MLAAQSVWEHTRPAGAPRMCLLNIVDRREDYSEERSALSRGIAKFQEV